VILVPLVITAVGVLGAVIGGKAMVFGAMAIIVEVAEPLTAAIE
jgi:hypothetical protein